MRIPGHVLITAAVITPAYALSMVALAATHHPTTIVQHLALSRTSSSHIPKQATLGTATTTQQSTPVNTVSSATAHSSPQPSTPPTTRPRSSPPNNPPAPVTIKSATISDWQDGTNITCGGMGDPNDTECIEQQIRDCMYTYSDSSTKQIKYDQRYRGMQTGTIVNQTSPTFSCDISTAPAPN
jgi:Spy/CpxP family protein refolding chaperone